MAIQTPHRNVASTELLALAMAMDRLVEVGRAVYLGSNFHLAEITRICPEHGDRLPCTDCQVSE